VIKSGEMRLLGACGTFFERIETYALFWWGNLMEGDRLEDLGVDGRVILRRADLTVKGREDMAWINLLAPELFF